MPNHTRRDAQLDEALAEYRRRVDAGETIDVAEFVASHPDVAAELREQFRTSKATATGSRQRVSTHSRLKPEAETVTPVRNPGTGGGTPEELPKAFGRYEVLRLLGRGAMGAVYLARDSKLGREVALKTSNFDQDATGELRKRFQREAQVAARLRHPNICAVYDVDCVDGDHFISMAYLCGRPLSAYVGPQKPFSERQSLVLVRKLAQALQEAHAHGVIHRDLKPGNVMIDARGEPIITDFGLARIADQNEQSRLTQTGMLVGSPGYMSPEQVEGAPDKLTPATDQYSLGVILYEVLTGRLPFDGSIANILAAIMTREPTPLSVLRPEIDPRLDAFCRRMMAKRAADRFPTMKAVADEASNLLKSLRPADGRKAAGSSRLEPADPFLTQGMCSAQKITEISRAATKFLAQHEYEQALRMLEQIPESQRTDEVRALLQKARSLTDRVLSLVSEIDEAMHRRDSAVALNRAAELERIKPGHPCAKKARESRSAPRVGSRRAAQSPQPASKAESRRRKPRHVVGIGMLGVLLLLGVATVYFRSGDAVVKVTIHDDAVRVTLQDKTLSIENAGEPVKVRPGIGKLTIVRDDLTFESSAFTLKKGENPAVVVELVDGQLGAKFGETPLGNWKLSDVSGKSPSSVDPATDPSRLRPSEILTSPDWEWSAAENLGTKINTKGREHSPSITADEKTLVFIRDGNIFMSRRSSVDVPFPEAEKLKPPISKKDSGEKSVCISGDGLTLAFSSNRGRNPQGDIFLAERSSIDAPFADPRRLIAPVHSGTNERSPHLSFDGRELIVQSARKGGYGSADLYRFTRPARNAAFAGEENLGPVVNTPGLDVGGALTADGLGLFRTSLGNADDEESEGGGRLVLCLRKSKDEPFQEARPLGPPFDKILTLIAVPSTDGRRLYFGAKLDNGWGGLDLWMCRRVPKHKVEMGERSSDPKRLDSPPRPPATPAVVALTPFAQLPAEFVFTTAASPDGKRIAGGNAKLTRIWDAANGSTLIDLKLEAPLTPRTLAFSPDGRTLAWGGWGNEEIRLYDARTGEKIRTFEGNTGFVTSLWFSSDGTRLLSGAQGRRAGQGYQFSHGPNTRVWSVDTGRQLRKFDGDNVSVGGCWLSDGRRAVSRNGSGAMGDETGSLVRLWDTETGAEERVFGRDLTGVRTVALSPHQKYVAASLKNDVVLVWDVETGNQLQRFEPAGHAAFTSDGERVLCSSKNGASFRIWDVKSGAELMRVEQKLPDGVGAIHVFPQGNRAIVSTYQSAHVFNIPLATK